MKLTARQIAVVAWGFAATMPLMGGARSDSGAPIGVFDSGLGGLTVLERLLDVDQVNNATGLYGPDGVPDLAHESFTYLGDQANMPYGDYAAEGKSDYLRELILKDAKFLLATNYYRCDREVTPGGTKKRAKIIVIACNTATAWGLDDVRKYLASVGDGTQVVGVIEAGVRATLDHVGAQADSQPFALGVMATPGTIASGAYERTIRAELKARGVTCDVPVVNQGCAGLADAVESGSPAADSIARSNLVSLVEQYRASGKSAPIKAVILGCTHYPFVLGTLEKTVAELRAKGAPFAADFRFVDPAFYTAAECHRILRESGRLAGADGALKVDAFLSVANPTLPPECLTSDGQLTRAFKYGRDVGSDAVITKPVPFTRERFGEDMFRNIGRLLPRTAAMLDSKTRTSRIEEDASLGRVKANFVRVLRTVAVSEKWVERLIRAQRADGSWPSVDYTTALRSQWPANEHLKNLRTLASARRTPETEQAFHKALGFWLNGRFRNPNWWWNQIGVPLSVGASALLMDDALTAEERAGVVKLMQESGIRMTGQNKVWLAECVLMRALLEGKAPDARAARDAIASEVAVSKTVEGIQADWSFHQHGNQAQFGNYGAAYILSIARFAVIFSGTGLDFPDDKLVILENLLDKGFRPTVWRGSMDIGSVGRQFTENAQRLKGQTPLAASWWLARTGRPNAVRIFRDCRADFRGERAEVPHLGLTWFPNSAMGMYRTERWMAAVKCETAHIKGTELVNEDNLLGAHLADGALFTYVTGDEYRDIFPLWNWRHIPGTTSYDVDTVDWKSRNRAEDCAADGTTVHFTLDRAGLTAHTRWRFSPEGVDVSVTGITSARELPVVTTVEQSLAQPNAAFRREKDGIVAVNGAIRYELPSNALVRIEERSGSWRRHMGSMPDQRAAGRVFEITIPHGVKPSAASCAWRVGIRTIEERSMK